MGNIRLYGSTSGYTELAPPAVAPDGVLSLPSGTGTIAKTTDQGLVHINTTTFTSVSSVSLDNIFTSSYVNYRIVVTGTNVNNGDINMRFRVSSADDSTGNYFLAKNLVSQTGTASTGFVNAGSFFALQTNNISSGFIALSLDIFNPNQSLHTHLHGGGFNLVSSSYGHQIMTGTFNSTSAFDGFSMITSGGNMSGTIRVYGYKNGA